jgi:hypothetical protein
LAEAALSLQPSAEVETQREDSPPLTPTREAALTVQSPKLPPSTVTLDEPVAGPFTVSAPMTTGALKLSKGATVLTTTELVEATPRIPDTPAVALLESALSEIHPVVD